jgi:hypothetical protein
MGIYPQYIESLESQIIGSNRTKGSKQDTQKYIIAKVVSSSSCILQKDVGFLYVVHFPSPITLLRYNWKLLKVALNTITLTLSCIFRKILTNLIWFIWQHFLEDTDYLWKIHFLPQAKSMITLSYPVKFPPGFHLLTQMISNPYIVIK